MKFDEFVRFAEAKLTDHGCGVCKSTETSWTAIGASDPGGVPTPVPGLSYFKTDEKDKAVDSYLAAGFPTMVMECNNCGHLHLFSMRKIRRWLDQNPADGDSSADTTLGKDAGNHE